MIERYIELLESFKKNQLSKLIELISNKLFRALKSTQLNPKIAPYFSTINQDGPPFIDYDLDPDNVSQVKKLMNALYHARLTFLDLENINIRNWEKIAPNLGILYGKTIDKAYEACYLATHLDINLQDLFQEEFGLLKPLIAQLESFAAKNAKHAKQLTESLKTHTLSSYTIGEITGTALEQMQPSTGTLDYDFLTQFSAILPGYIDRVTQHFRKYTSKFTKNEPTLNTEQMEELQNTARTLLNELESLKGGGLFLSFKFLNYIHIIRTIITLSMSSLQQMGNLSESSENVIRDKLAHLKYNLFPTLFGLVDKIEVNSMLKPQTLSAPLMNKIKMLYETLIYYASKPVNFKAKGEELLSIEDSHFLSLRLERTYQRIDTANKSLFKIKRAEEALTRFYAILEMPLYKNLSLHQIPQEVKDELITYYKIIKPYMAQVDVDFNEQIINSLNGKYSRVAALLSWVRSTHPEDHVRLILKRKDAVARAIIKRRNTQQFHIEVNTDLINSVQRTTDLILFPYSEHRNVFIIDESIIFNQVTPALKFKIENGNTVVANPENLTADEALNLHQWYRNKHEQFMVAREAYDEFIALLVEYANPGLKLHLNQLTPELKTQCRKLYNIFQPYFINGVPEHDRKQAIAFDKILVHFFAQSTSNGNQIDAPAINLFAEYNVHFQSFFTTIDLIWRKASQYYSRLAEQKLTTENDSQILDKNKDTERAHYLIKHTNYSKFVHEFRQELYKTTGFLNNAMKRTLKACPTGIPFPELENKTLILAQSNQTLGIKKIFNCLYHVEGIILDLEKLNDKSIKSMYVYHLTQAYNHLNEIMNLTQCLVNDPHFGLLAQDLLEKSRALWATTQEHSDAYQVSPIGVTDDTPVRFSALWYSLNAFYISPKHIRSLSNSSYLNTEEIENLHIAAKKSTLSIEKIIQRTESKFQLFLQVPNMLFLYQELKRKLNEFISTLHDSGMNNLGEFNTEVFIPMLLEADLWEDNLGLIPGTFSSPLKKIIDEFYRGLLHPLNLHSKTHIGLICDKNSIEQRITITQKKIDNASKQLEQLEVEYRGINLFLKEIEVFEEFSLFRSRKPFTLINAFKEILPQLVSLKDELHFQPTPRTKPKEMTLDLLLNSELNEYDIKLSHIKQLAHACRSYYLGLKLSQLMSLNTAQEKRTYLNILSATQDQDNAQFIKEYIDESFNTQLETMCNRHIGLQYTDKEYRNKLQEHLLTFKNEIIAQANTAENINLRIKELLKEKVMIFEAKNYVKYYHLDTVRVALAQFKNYFSLSTLAIEHQNSLFENDKTLEKKTAEINRLIGIAENEQLSIEVRFTQIKNHVKNPNFERIMLNHKEINNFSFAYVALCILSLLEALSLYTPDRTVRFNELNRAVNNEPKINELTKRFGLFTTTSHSEKTTNHLTFKIQCSRLLE